MQENLYIEIENGQPINHPLLETNLVQVYGSVENIPEKFQPFNRVLQNVSYTVFQRLLHTYERVGRVWQDVWTVQDLTGDELLNAKQNLLDQSLAELPNLKERSKKILANSVDDEEKYAVSLAYVEILENLELTIDNPAIPDPPVLMTINGEVKWVLK